MYLEIEYKSVQKFPINSLQLINQKYFSFCMQCNHNDKTQLHWKVLMQIITR